MRRVLAVGLPWLGLVLGGAACESSNNTNPVGGGTGGWGSTSDGGSGNPPATSTTRDWTMTRIKPVELYAIWGSGPNDVWAVGAENNIVHYDGAAWSTVVSGANGSLSAIWGSGPNDVWAGGFLMEHWDGRTWSEVTIPAKPINSIWGSSASDVWAVGGSGAALALHWDGTAWTQVDVGPDAHGLQAVWGSGPRDVWAVGGNSILHWDGQAWTVALQGTSTLALFDMYGIWGSAANDVWAVGAENIAHWDGVSWRTERCTASSIEYVVGSETSPCPTDLSGIWGNASNDVWAWGNGDWNGFVVHWDGVKWTMSYIAVPEDLLTTGFNPIRGLWSNGPKNVWTVGPVYGGAMIMHYAP